MLKPSPSERFWAKVAKLAADECWPWQASKDPDGYGQMHWGGKPIRAHRISWEIHKAASAPTTIRHTCDNRGCVNPAHLVLGTQADNIADAVARGRIRHGTAHYKAKLTEADVIAIRASTLRLFELAAKYDIDRMTVKAILTRKTWKHL